jgi:hypothetical protein
MRPPRTAETILRSLGARAIFSEPMIGDLAEGFALRVEREGAGAARRWYFRETIRAVPHLLRDWARSLQMRDIRRLGGIILTSYVFAFTLAVLLIGLTKGAFDAVGLSPHVRFGRPPNTQIGILWFPVQLMCTVMTGYFAAWLDNRAPLTTAIATGVALACPAFVVAFSHMSAAALFVVLAAVLEIGGATLGGLLRLRSRAVIRRADRSNR